MLKFDESGNGLAVVLIHGFPLCRKMWRPQVIALVDAGYRVICPDLPGFGETPPLAESASMGRYADALIGLLDQLEIEKAVVGGMSMGGYVLLKMAERYPERLLGAMYLMTRAAADEAASREKRSLLAGEVNAGNRLVVADAFAQVLFAPETLQKNPQLVAEVRQWMETTSPAGLVGGLLAMRDRDDYVAKLAGFAVPSLVVGAEQDLAVPLEHSRVLVKWLPDAELQTIPAAGHMANLEQPEAFNTVLEMFLKRFKA
ncbi:MAG: alpha/beta fold hydrolase [Desulfuromonadales bacterium]|nr:alpha/beta fold hydrolase [Desulfuromonadales bacterium]